MRVLKTNLSMNKAGKLKEVRTNIQKFRRTIHIERIVGPSDSSLEPIVRKIHLVVVFVFQHVFPPRLRPILRMSKTILPPAIGPSVRVVVCLFVIEKACFVVFEQYAILGDLYHIWPVKESIINIDRLCFWSPK
jgi:hypothetical protein